MKAPLTLSLLLAVTGIVVAPVRAATSSSTTGERPDTEYSTRCSKAWVDQLVDLIKDLRKDLKRGHEIKTNIARARRYLDRGRERKAVRRLEDARAILAAFEDKAPSYTALKQRVDAIIEAIERDETVEALGELVQLETELFEVPQPTPDPSGLSADQRFNRKEWKGEIRYLILYVGSGKFDIARREARKLLDSIEEDGDDSEFDQELAKRVQFVVVYLNEQSPDGAATTQQLQDIYDTLENSLK